MSSIVVKTTGKRPLFGTKKAPTAAKYSKIKYGLYKQPSTNLHHYTRVATNNTHTISVTGSQTATQGGFGNGGVYDLQFSFTLNAVRVYLGGVFWASLFLPNVAEFSGLYDQYRIDWVDFEIGFTCNDAESVSGNNAYLPFLTVAKDYDDCNTASTTDLNQYNNCKMIQLGNSKAKPFDMIRVKPRCLTSIKVSPDSGSSTYSISPMLGKENPWLDTTNTNVEHMGIKMAYWVPSQPVNTTTYGFLLIRAKYHFCCRNAR